MKRQISGTESRWRRQVEAQTAAHVFSERFGMLMAWHACQMRQKFQNSGNPEQHRGHGQAIQYIFQAFQRDTVSADMQQPRSL